MMRSALSKQETPVTADTLRASLENAPFATPKAGNGGGNHNGKRPVAVDNDDRLPSCPVVPLGHRDGKFFFLDAKGQLRSLSARQLETRGELMALFMDEGMYMRERWPHEVFNKYSKEMEVVDFDRKNVSDWMMAECGKVGIFGPQIIIRRPGIWPEGSREFPERPVVHCGDTVFYGGRAKPAGLRIENQIWAADAAQPKPETPAPVTVGLQFSEYLRTGWNWDKPGAHVAVLGWLGCAYLGSSIDWRPAMFLTGRAGSGKSMLLEMIKEACPLRFSANDTTKAGLEQELNGASIPALIDESSDGTKEKLAEALLDLVLTASGGQGATIKRGSSDGQARSLGVSGSVMMASINTPQMNEAHLGRFTLIELKAPERDADEGVHIDHKQLQRWARNNGAALWGRVLSHWQEWHEARAIFRRKLEEEKGCPPRELDQLTALMAGWWVLTYDGVPDERGALEGIGALEAFIRNEDDAQLARSSNQMIDFLLSQLVQVQRSTERQSIAELIRRVVDNDQGTIEDEAGLKASISVLSQYGIRVITAEQKDKDSRGRSIPREAEGLGIWFNPRCDPLIKLFKDTPFSGQKLEMELRRLESARVASKPLRIGAIIARRPIWVSGEELGFGPDAYL